MNISLDMQYIFSLIGTEYFSRCLWIFHILWLLSESMGKVKLAMTHKVCRKTKFVYFVFQNMSHWDFFPDHLQSALPNRVRWSLARGGCQILAFPPDSPYFHLFASPFPPPHSQDQIKSKTSYFCCHFPASTRNVERLQGSLAIEHIPAV